MTVCDGLPGACRFVTRSGHTDPVQVSNSGHSHFEVAVRRSPAAPGHGSRTRGGLEVGPCRAFASSGPLEPQRDKEDLTGFWFAPPRTPRQVATFVDWVITYLVFAVLSLVAAAVGAPEASKDAGGRARPDRACTIIRNASRVPLKVLYRA